MQDSLFPEDEDGSPPASPPAAAAPSPSHHQQKRAARGVLPQPPDPTLLTLARQLPAQLRMGTSSWHFPGWNGLVWDGDYAESRLSREGLPAYAQHPLLRSVSLDRAFYQPLSVLQYMKYADQVPADFRFVVKAPALVADAMLRGDQGRGLQANPAFLDPARAFDSFVQPALQGLGSKAGALVFQISPLPPAWLGRMPQLLQRLHIMLQGVREHLAAADADLQALAKGSILALEVRDPAFLDARVAPELVRILKQADATYCLGLHAKMPPIEAQLPLLRALWPGPLVCRWNLHRRHGAYGYQQAKDGYAPFDRIQDADPQTRAQLARVIAGTTAHGHAALVTINNKAEGSAPLTVQALAEQLLALQPPPR